MSRIDVLKFTSDELTDEKLKELIVKKESFCVVAVKNMSHTVNKIEGTIEKQSLRCRVYVENRSALIGGALVASLVPNPIWPVTFIASLTGAATATVGAVVHNIATYNPDYEIRKNIPNSMIFVTYKKE